MSRARAVAAALCAAFLLLPTVSAEAKDPKDRLRDRLKPGSPERKEELDDMRKRDKLPTAPAPATPGEPMPGQGQGPQRAPSLVGMHHGSVGIVGDLARVDLTLTVTNQNTIGSVEWRQTYAVDPRAEVIGAVLRRRTGAPILARTLTLGDARRIYDEARTLRPRRVPNRTRRPSRGRDPLRLERLAQDRLSIVVFPVDAGETVSIDLTFVTPLRGRGAHRIYEDVMGGRGLEPQVVQPNQPARPKPQRERPTTFVRTPDKAQWIVRTHGLVLDAEPEGMKLAEEWADGTLRFTGVAHTTADSRRPSIPMIVPQPENVAISVRSGGFGNRTALWRFDPKSYLESKGITPSRGIELRLLGHGKETSRIAPWSFHAHDDPLPVAAHVRSVKRGLRYTVQVLDKDGNEIRRFEERLPIRTVPVQNELEVALTGWHRAALVRRVNDWAEGDAKRRVHALRYAVDVGVLVQGTAALAVPNAELRMISRESRRLYRQDGAVLGAQRREADLKVPPSGSMSER
ncbi:MAG: hypothetical protein QNJ98_17560 [Planctomycetota bacterium]|nr:hypothetical protein [Planctomycetota bacterium]